MRFVKRCRNPRPVRQPTCCRILPRVRFGFESPRAAGRTRPQRPPPEAPGPRTRPIGPPGIKDRPVPTSNGRAHSRRLLSRSRQGFRCHRGPPRGVAEQRGRAQAPIPALRRRLRPPGAAWAAAGIPTRPRPAPLAWPLPPATRIRHPRHTDACPIPRPTTPARSGFARSGDPAPCRARLPSHTVRPSAVAASQAMHPLPPATAAGKPLATRPTAGVGRAARRAARQAGASIRGWCPSVGWRQDGSSASPASFASSRRPPRQAGADTRKRARRRRCARTATRSGSCADQ